MNAEDAEYMAPTIPIELKELPASTRIWLGSLTPEKLARLKQLDKLADDVDPARIRELVSIAEKAETLKKAGVWIVAGLFLLITAVAPVLDLIDRAFGWLKAVPKG